MSGVQAIRAALEPALDTAVNIALEWENTPYTPVTGTPYGRVFLMLARPFNPEMGGLVQENGFLQVNLCYPLGTGPAAAEAMAETIRAAFKRGTSLTSGGVTTTVSNTPEIAPAMTDEDFRVVPVRIPFHAHYIPAGG